MVHDLSTMQRMNDEATSHVDAEKCQRMEESLDMLIGDRERFRKELEDKDEILARLCDIAEQQAFLQKREPWMLIHHFTGYGSGMSSAIYNLYRRREG